MIKRLIELKAFIKDLDSQCVSLTEEQWQQTAKLEKVLSYPYIVTGVDKLDASVTPN